jgi:hypothetical protein
VGSEKMPEISATGEPDVLSPFSAPFGVKNKGWLFDMRSAQLNCMHFQASFQAHIFNYERYRSSSSAARFLASIRSYSPFAANSAAGFHAASPMFAISSQILFIC